MNYQDEVLYCVIADMRLLVNNGLAALDKRDAAAGVQEWEGWQSLALAYQASIDCLYSSCGLASEFYYDEMYTLFRKRRRNSEPI